MKEITLAELAAAQPRQGSITLNPVPVIEIPMSTLTDVSEHYRRYEDLTVEFATGAKNRVSAEEVARILNELRIRTDGRYGYWHATSVSALQITDEVRQRTSLTDKQIGRTPKFGRRRFLTRVSATVALAIDDAAKDAAKASIRAALSGYAAAEDIRVSFTWDDSQAGEIPWDVRTRVLDEQLVTLERLAEEAAAELAAELGLQVGELIRSQHDRGADSHGGRAAGLRIFQNGEVELLSDGRFAFTATYPDGSIPDPTGHRRASGLIRIQKKAKAAA